ncbi:MAG TPA: ABC transporter ATP-binding protein [Hyphomonadaceae bacterium]|jgi:ABC-2 type transport system ATP-binding protein|nr:ABC transporter ATP-binding protein [Hyphomonadaceae bacterium]
MIETQSLTRHFGKRLAVDGVSMTVPDKAVYGFLGRNGAGKTTTLKMLLGLIRPDSGTAKICGIDVSQDRIGAARKIGALLEAHGFYANLSGQENLELTRRLLGVAPSEIDRVLDVVDMTANAARRVGQYSLGMKQRLGLARAMIGAPPVLILDEPTNGLDPDGIADMRAFLKTLPERTGATVLLSSHLLGEIEQIASHVGIIHEGRLMLEGDLAQLKAGLAPQITVDTDDPARVSALATGRGFAVSQDAGRVVAKLKPGDDARTAAATLNRALNEAGIAVFSIGPSARTLEGIYRDVSAPTTNKEAA